MKPHFPLHLPTLLIEVSKLPIPSHSTNHSRPCSGQFPFSSYPRLIISSSDAKRAFTQLHSALSKVLLPLLPPATVRQPLHQFNNDKNLHKNVLKVANKTTNSLRRRLISPRPLFSLLSGSYLALCKLIAHVLYAAILVFCCV